MRRLACVLSVLAGVSVAAGGGCKRGTLGGPDAGEGEAGIGLGSGTGGDGSGGAGAGVGSGGATGTGTGTGGTIAIGGAGGGGRDGAVDGAATDAVTWVTDGVAAGCPAVPSTPVCPPTSPRAGAACPLAGAKCEYANTPNVQCRVMWSCGTGLTWQLALPGCSTETCPVEADAQAGAACTPPGWCAYADAFCSCGGSQHWTCWAPSPGCPAQLPVYGSTCDQNGQLCRYGGCTDYFSICCGGSWVTQRAGACTE
ncbi:MAG TPA: hypothetical protein VIF57_04130 [Polyangia bacterium]|jgi:hypothetical protein